MGTLVSIVIAGCSLAIATAAAMLERKRVFGLLRLIGMPTADLRRIVGLEAAAPLLTVLGLSIGLGFAVAWFVMECLPGGFTMSVPEPAYFITIAGGLALALGTVGATFGTIRKNTAISSTRFE